MGHIQDLLHGRSDRMHPARTQTADDNPSRSRSYIQQVEDTGAAPLYWQEHGHTTMQPYVHQQQWWWCHLLVGLIITDVGVLQCHDHQAILQWRRLQQPSMSSPSCNPQDAITELCALQTLLLIRYAGRWAALLLISRPWIGWHYFPLMTSSARLWIAHAGWKHSLVQSAVITPIRFITVCILTLTGNTHTFYLRV